MKAAATVQNLRTMDAAFTIAQAHLRVGSDDWDREPHLLAVHNGVVDLPNRSPAPTLARLSYDSHGWVRV